MKALVLLLLAPTLALGASPVGLLPQEKVPITVETSERNPFGRKATAAVAQADELSEEVLIRGILENLQVGGVTASGSDVTVLLGPLVIAQGNKLPPVIDNQTEIIQVIAVNTDKVEFAFVEADGKPGNRKLTIPFNSRPEVRVRYRINSGEKEEKATPGEFEETLSKDEISGQR